MKLQDFLSNTTSDRNTLKPKFNTGEIPTQQDFHDLIDNLFLLQDDSVYKDKENGLAIKVGETDKKALLLYDDFNEPKWKISIEGGFHLQDKDSKSVFSVSERGEVSVAGAMMPKTGEGENVGIVFDSVHSNSDDASYVTYYKGTKREIPVDLQVIYWKNKDFRKLLKFYDAYITNFIESLAKEGFDIDMATLEIIKSEMLLTINAENLVEKWVEEALVESDWNTVLIAIKNELDDLNVKDELEKNLIIKKIDGPLIKKIIDSDTYGIMNAIFLYQKFGAEMENHIEANSLTVETAVLNIGIQGNKNPEIQLSNASGDIVLASKKIITKANLQVEEGAIIPQEGNDEQSGILFPKDAFGVTGGRAYIRYYNRDIFKEDTILEIGNQSKDADHIALMPSGNVGIGVLNPQAKLQVQGGAIMPQLGNNERGGILFRQNTVGGRDDKAYIRYYLRFGANSVLEIGNQNDAGNHNHIALMGGGNVGIGTLHPEAKLQVKGGAIMPQEGNSESAGILFPKDAFGGNSDRAYIRYYASSGENTVLEIGNQDDTGDHIALMSSGNVGIGILKPEAKLQVKGGAIMPQEGNDEQSGILFPKDAFGGGGDRAYIRYYRDGSSGENTILEIGTTNDAKDHVKLFSRKGNIILDASKILHKTTVVHGSDANLKKNISYPSSFSPLQKIAAIQPASYHFKTEEDTSPKKLGVVAQDLQKILPDAVTETIDGDGTKTLYVDYQYINMVTLQAVKELKKEVEHLKQQLLK